MTDRTYDVEDSRDLPYRFVWSPITQEVMVVSRGSVVAFFENKDAFHRFLLEGNNFEFEIQSKLINEAMGIIRDKQGG